MQNKPKKFAYIRNFYYLCSVFVIPNIYSIGIIYIVYNTNEKASDKTLVVR